MLLGLPKEPKSGRNRNLKGSGDTGDFAARILSQGLYIIFWWKSQKYKKWDPLSLSISARFGLFGQSKQHAEILLLFFQEHFEKQFTCSPVL